MFLFVKIFCQPLRKRVIENKQAFGGTSIKGIKPFNFGDNVNLKLLHIVHIYMYSSIYIHEKKNQKKFVWNFLKNFFFAKISNFKKKKKKLTNLEVS